jgi:uncharacterized protein (DUF2141 family)
VLSEDAVVTRMSAYFGVIIAGQVRTAVYADASGAPGTLIVQSQPQPIGATGWTGVDVPDTELPAGTYWLALQSYGGSQNTSINTTGGTARSLVYAWGDFPGTLAGASSSTWDVALRAEYCLPTGVPTHTPTDTPTSTPTATSTFTPTFTETALCVGPYTFGRTSVGANTTYYGSVYANRRYMPNPGTVMRLRMYGSNGNAVSLTRVAIYADNAGVPGDLIVQSNALRLPTSSGWHEVEVPDTPLPAGYYWLAFRSQAFNSRYDAVSNAEGYRMVAAFGEFPSTFTGSPDVSYEFSVHAEYCLPPGADTPTFTPTPTDTATPTSTETPLCGTSYLMGSGADRATWANLQGYLWANAQTLVEDGVVTRLRIRTGGSTYLKAAIYADAAGEPGDLIVASQESAVSAGWNTIEIVDTPLAAGTYWLAFLQSGAMNVQLSTTGGTARSRLLAYGSFPASFGSGSVSAWDVGICAEYCLPAGVPTHTPTDTFTSTATPTATPTATSTETPLCATPSTFGNPSVGGSVALFGSMMSNKHQLSQGGTLTDVVVRAAGNGNPANMIRVGVYRDVSGTPTDLVVQSNPQTLPVGSQWVTVQVPDTFLSAGEYWFALLTTGSNATLPYATTGSSLASPMTWGPLPPTHPGGSSNTYLFSVYGRTCP